jgi:hypothetical protein
MDKDTIWREISKLAKYYNASDRMSAEVMNIYVEHLRDMNYETFKLAVDRHIETSTWMPTIAQIREAAMTNFIKRAGVPSPGEAWGEVSKNLKNDRQVNAGTLTSVNYIDDHEWSHPIVRKAAEQIGWQDLYWAYREGGAGAMVSNRARYMDTYRELLEGLKEHHTLTPDLQMAITPPERPQIEAPKKQPDNKSFRRDDAVPMPDRIREKWLELKTRVEANPLPKRKDIK